MATPHAARPPKMTRLAVPLSCRLETALRLRVGRTTDAASRRPQLP